MKTWICCLAGLAILAPLSAGPITVTISFTGTGTVGASPFTNASVLITGTGDTIANTGCGAGCFFMHPATTTIAIAGFSLASVTDSNTFGDNQGAGSAYFSTTTDELIMPNVAFATYNLTTSLGPLNPAINPSNWATIGVHTNQGIINVSSASNATYQAVVSGGATAPEPGSVALMLGGLAAIAAITRLRGPVRGGRRTLRFCVRLSA
jgi:hypothetical protein